MVNELDPDPALGDSGTHDLGRVSIPREATIEGGRIEVDLPATRFLLDDLERDAQKLAESIAHVSGGLEVNLHALSMICTQYTAAHQVAVDGIGDAVDRSLSAMASLMVGCEQVSDNMPPVEQLMGQLKTVKRTLDLLESSVNGT